MMRRCRPWRVRCWATLDPLERERLRQTVQQYGGDRVLLELDDDALDGALGFTVRNEAGPTRADADGLVGHWPRNRIARQSTHA
jgi:hypothetical protein